MSDDPFEGIPDEKNFATLDEDDEYNLESTDLDIVDEPIGTPKILSFSAGKIHLDTGEVELDKEVSEAAEEFWEEIEKAFPLG